MLIRRVTIPYKPRALFRAYHAREQRWAGLVVHRRAGRTVGCINNAIRRAVGCTLPDGRYGYIAPQLNQAKDVAWNYLKRYTAPLIQDKNEGDLWVEVPNAARSVSRIRLYGADNADRIRGGYFDGVVIDEYADMGPSVFGEIIRPMLADRQGWGTFIGTLKGRNHLWKLIEDHEADPDWFTMVARASETGILPDEELADMRKDMTPEEYEQEMECNPDAAIRGAYYGKELAHAEAMGRMLPLTAVAEMPVHTAWDLGIGDSTAIWWWQAVGSDIRVLDYYENHGHGLDHYAKVCAAKPWKRGDDWVPHDARVRELGTGRTRIETLIGLGCKPRLVPDHKVDDGINAVRMVLSRCYFAMPTTRDGVETLKQYQNEFDQKLRTFKERPRHDWTSHCADAFRAMAMAYREIVPKPLPAKDRMLAVGQGNEVRFEDLWPSGPQRRARI